MICSPRSSNIVKRLVTDGRGSAGIYFQVLILKIINFLRSSKAYANTKLEIVQVFLLKQTRLPGFEEEK
jgi:hypothetical protein